MNMHIEVPQIVRADEKGRRHDRNMVTVQMYKGPLDGRPDLYAKFDMWCAGQVMGILEKHHPGYPWMAECNAAQGMISISIPVLMGPTLKYALKLKDWESLALHGEKMVMEGAGNLLERFNLPRTGFEAATFLKARDHRELAQIDFRKRNV